MSGGGHFGLQFFPLFELVCGDVESVLCSPRDQPPQPIGHPLFNPPLKSGDFEEGNINFDKFPVSL